MAINQGVSYALCRAYTPFGVWGSFLLPSGKSISTLERPWLGNKPFVSCIPEGTYSCKRVNSPRFGVTFKVTSVVDRTEILFHWGNDIEDTEGCVLVGLSKSILNNRLKVVDSRKAFALFMSEFSDVDEFTLVVKTETAGGH